MANEENEDLDTSWLEEEGDSGSSLSAVQEGAEKSAPASPYAIKLDEWGKRKGRDLKKAEGFTDIELPEEDLADLHGMSFEMEPEIIEHCADPIKHEFIKALQDNPEYQALHGETQWDTDASELAALHFSREYNGFRTKRKEQHRIDAADKSGKSPTPQQQLQREMQALAAAQKCSQEAAAEVQEFKDMQAAMGIGKGEGGGGQVNSKELKQMFKKLKNDKTLQDICEMAGRYRMVARSKQRQKVTHGYDDMIGVEFDDDLGRMLASELAQMGCEELEGEAVRRFVEKEMLCRKYQGIENVGKGPIIVMPDESGSMTSPGPDGVPRIVHAKAMCLSLGWVAKSQNRWCAFVGWSSGNQVREIVLPPGKWDMAELMKWLSKFWNGGTHFPMTRLMSLYTEMGAPKGKTDVIVITDGELDANSGQEKADFDKWKVQAECKIIGISIGSDSKGLKDISDEYFRIASMSADDEAVGRALSI